VSSVELKRGDDGGGPGETITLPPGAVRSLTCGVSRRAGPCLLASAGAGSLVLTTLAASLLANSTADSERRWSHGKEVATRDRPHHAADATRERCLASSPSPKAVGGHKVVPCPSGDRAAASGMSPRSHSSLREGAILGLVVGTGIGVWIALVDVVVGESASDFCRAPAAWHASHAALCFLPRVRGGRRQCRNMRPQREASLIVGAAFAFFLLEFGF